MKKLVLCGMSCTGKTTTKHALVDHGLKPGISYTTRPIRNGEQEGIDYRFVKKERFLSLVEQGFFFEHDDSFGEYYGTSIEDFESCDVFILTPKAINQLREVGLEDRCLIVRLTSPLNVRVKRASERGDSTVKILNRMHLDDTLFSTFSVDGIVEIPSDGNEVQEILKILRGNQ